MMKINFIYMLKERLLTQLKVIGWEDLANGDGTKVAKQYTNEIIMDRCPCLKNSRRALELYVAMEV